jgi:hypothetical protein
LLEAAFLRDSLSAFSNLTMVKAPPTSEGPYFYWSRWPDLNRRPADYESAALPLSHIGLLFLDK